MKHLTRFFIGALCLLCTSCATTAVLSQRGPYLRSYHEGRFNEAEATLNALVKNEIPEKEYCKSKEASWILLDRATTRFAAGSLDGAIQDYAMAIESLDYYNQDLAAEKVGQLMLQDETGAYQAADFEQILARVYFALALLHDGDESNAYAVLRQAEEYQQDKQAAYSTLPFTRQYRIANNGLSKYLFALLLEKRGDRANASILFKQAAQLIPCPESMDQEPSHPNNAKIVVICHNGNAPYKISTTCPASVASVAALEVLLAEYHNTPALSTLTGIPVPALRLWPYSQPRLTFAFVDDVQKSLVPFYRVDQAAQEELYQKLPVIAARGVARLAIRRCAVGYMGRKDPGLGLLADLTMCVVNYNTRADTRSWTTLPAVIDVAHFNVQPGMHTLDILAYDYVPSPLPQRFQLQLKPNDLCIVHVFNIHPGITRILIPNRFIKGE